MLRPHGPKAGMKTLAGRHCMAASVDESQDRECTSDTLYCSEGRDHRKGRQFGPQWTRFMFCEAWQSTVDGLLDVSLGCLGSL